MFLIYYQYRNVQDMIITEKNKKRFSVVFLIDSYWIYNPLMTSVWYILQIDML